MTKRQIKRRVEWAEYCLRNGGYNINPVPGAHGILELALHAEQLEEKLAKCRSEKGKR